jgi:rhamnosyltransferase
MTIPPQQANIAAIVVLYAPPPTLQEALQKLAKQVQWVIIVDNGANEAHKASLKLPASQFSWLSNPENGLAKAQNMGIRHAQEKGADWLLLMDDDSNPAEDMIAGMLRGWNLLAKKEQSRLGIFGAHIEEINLPRPALYIQALGKFGFRRVGFTKSPLLKNLFYVCASGSLIPMRAIQQCGMMREDFGIYFIDTEFCLRLRKQGFEVATAAYGKLTHRIGQRSNHRLAGVTISTTNHAPKSRYLMFRNRRVLWWEYARYEPGYVLFDLLRAMSEILRVTLFEPQKYEKLRAMFCGLCGFSYKV